MQVKQSVKLDELLSNGKRQKPVQTLQNLFKKVQDGTGKEVELKSSTPEKIAKVSTSSKQLGKK